MTTKKPTKGVILVAEPTIAGDISFNRSIVLLAENNKNGSVRFILNKPLEFKVKDCIPEVNSNLRVYNGGPVDEDKLYFIHRIPEIIPDSIEIANGIYWGGDFSAILNLLQEDKLNENQIRFFLGYSGWANEQLEQELKVNSWVVIPNEYKNDIIGKSNQDFWKEKMIEFGGDYVLWSNAPEDPSSN